MRTSQNFNLSTKGHPVLICIGRDTCCYDNYSPTTLSKNKNAFQGSMSCVPRAWSDCGRVEGHHWRTSPLSPALQSFLLSGFTQAVGFANMVSVPEIPYFYSK